jgi:hypothetical protein
MIHIDHICIASQNLYESTFRISQETGLGNYDGGFFPGVGAANKIIPLGGDSYIEVESIVNPYALTHLPSQEGVVSRMVDWFYKSVAKGDVFMGWCLRADSLSELRQVADYHKTEIRGLDHGEIEGRNDGRQRVSGTMVGSAQASFAGEAWPKEFPGRQRMNGTTVRAAQAPVASDAWPKGFPNTYVFADMSAHPSRIPVEPGSGRVTPKGIEWLEVGGTDEQMRNWLGTVPHASFPLRFNGKRPGLYAVAVSTDGGEVVIRRPSVNESV